MCRRHDHLVATISRDLADPMTPASVEIIIVDYIYLGIPAVRHYLSATFAKSVGIAQSCVLPLPDALPGWTAELTYICSGCLHEKYGPLTPPSAESGSA
jgi:hypothetical protein